MGSLVKTFAALKKYKEKEKVPEPIVDLNKHIDFHSSKSNGDVNSLIIPLNEPTRGKGGKQALKRLEVDESPEK